MRRAMLNCIVLAALLPSQASAHYIWWESGLTSPPANAHIIWWESGILANHAALWAQLLSLLGMA